MLLGVALLHHYTLQVALTGLAAIVGYQPIFTGFKFGARLAGWRLPAWLRHGWHVAVAYVIGFFVMLAVVGWHADARHKKRVETPPMAATAHIMQERK